MSSTPRALDFEYKIRFKRTERNYSLIHYNTPWDNDEKELEDLRIMFEGKDLKGKNLNQYKMIKWEDLEPGEYNASIRMLLYQTKTGAYEQLFSLNSLEKAKGLGDVK